MDIQRILDEDKMNSGQAAKVRGKFGWARTKTFGKCGRGGWVALVERQAMF